MNIAHGILFGFIALIILLIRIYNWQYNKKLNFDVSKILDMPVELRLVKDEYYDYIVEFYNPIYKEWWAIPETENYIHGPWSLNKIGSYGAYDLNKYKVSKNELEYVKNEFKTYNDIKNYFDEMNINYAKYKIQKDKEDKEPSIIY